MKREIYKHLLVLGVYFGVVMALHLVKTGFLLNLDLVWLWVGGVVGYVLVLFDRLVYIYILHTHEQLSQQARFMLGKKNFKGALELIHWRRGEQTRLAFRSFLFVVAWIPLAIFALTSTGEMFAGALVMGLGLHLLYDFWRDHQANPKAFNEKFFWQVKRLVNLKEQEAFLYIFSGVFVVLTFLII